jgi:hypothetical protein
MVQNRNNSRWARIPQKTNTRSKWKHLNAETEQPKNDECDFVEIYFMTFSAFLSNPGPINRWHSALKQKVIVIII